MNNYTVSHGARYICRLLEDDKHHAHIDGSYIYTSAKPVYILSLLANNGIETSGDYLSCGIVVAHLNDETYLIMEEQHA